MRGQGSATRGRAIKIHINVAAMNTKAEARRLDTSDPWTPTDSPPSARIREVAVNPEDAGGECARKT
jgi:hypothetical protein